MTEPLRKYHSSDVPDFASYPADSDRLKQEVSVTSEWDTLPAPRVSGYDDQARKIGYAFGRLVNRINDTITPVRWEIEDKVASAKETAQETYEEAANKVALASRQALYDARVKANELRRRAVQTVNDYPVHTLAAAGIAGILIGAGLRTWRENRG